MTYAVFLSAGARADLRRLHEHLLERAQTSADLDAADLAIAAIRAAVHAQLQRNPFICRKAAFDRPGSRRELVIPFGRTGYVALFEILPKTSASPPKVVVIAFRHQREADYR